MFLSQYKTMKSSCTDGFIEVTYGRKNLVSDWKDEAIRKRCIERGFFLLLAVTFGFCFIDNVLDFLSFSFKHKIGRLTSVIALLFYFMFYFINSLSPWSRFTTLLKRVEISLVFLNKSNMRVFN